MGANVLAVGSSAILHRVIAPRAPLALAVLAVVAATSRSAYATEDVPAAHEAHWYGWQNLIADGVAFGFVAGGAALGARHDDRINPDAAPAMAIFGAAAWLTFCPAIHLAHDRPQTALASLGLRSVPLIVLLMTINSGSCGGNTSSGESGCGSSIAAPLVVLASTTLGALLVDDLVLAREPSKSPPRVVTPTASLTRGIDGRTLTTTWGVGGTF